MAGDIFTATVERAGTPAPDVRELTLRPNGPPLAHAPGQWLSLRLPVGEKPPLVRAYTLAAPPQPDGALVLLFDRVPGGLGSEYLWTLAPGDRVEFSGPVGNFVLPPGDDDLVFVARYTGIVPFRAMLQALDNGAALLRRVHLVYGAPRPVDLVYHAELTELAARHDNWFAYHPTVTHSDANWGGMVGTELDLLESRARAWLPCTPLVCGVREFTLPTRAFFIEQLRFERRAVKVENYSGPSSR